ncbi:putative PGG domain-containing protein [Helianthus anomalus]
MLAGLAIELMEKFPVFASKRDDVLVAIAKTFPSGLENWETLVYPSCMIIDCGSLFLASVNIVKMLFGVMSFTLSLLRFPAFALLKFKNEGSSSIKAIGTLLIKLGTPLFRKETAFIIFAISDVISLFASSTALLVFLSILTARFAEKDFLVSLPRRLFIGLFSLLVSTTTMMIAFSATLYLVFGATLYLVFGDKKPWMLLPICGLAFIPISSFVTLQFPLMVDIFRSTIYPNSANKGRLISLQICGLGVYVSEISMHLQMMYLICF